MGRAEDIFDAICKRGIEAIDQFINDAVSEELFLDFKRSADSGAGRKLAQDDRNNLGRAISGFGNSEGGVIVWGVAGSSDVSKGDVAGSKAPMVQPARFKSWLEGAVSGVTVPAHGGVLQHVVPDDHPDRGFVVTLIPKSNHAPHQMIPNLQYFMRAGSSFLPVPHAILAGMFGRRPQPALSHRYEVAFTQSISSPEGRVLSVNIEAVLQNDGQGIAETIFMNVTAQTLPGRRCRMRDTRRDAKIDSWSYQAAHGRNMCAISRGIGLAPGAWAVPFDLEIWLLSPIDNSLVIEGTYGCAGGPIRRFGFSVSEDAIRAMITRYDSDLMDGDGEQESLRSFTQAFRDAIVSHA